MNSINLFVNRGLLKIKDYQVSCTDEGMMLLDIILRDIFI